MRAIERLRKAAAGREVMATDSDVPSLYVRVHPSGDASLVFRHREGGRVFKTTLGRVGNLTVDDARKTARAYVGRIALGFDPIAEKAAEAKRHSDALDARRRARIEAETSNVFTVRKLIELWASAKKADNRSPRYVASTRRTLEQTLASVLDLPARDLGKDQVEKLLAAAAAKRGPAAELRAYASINLAYARALKEGRLEVNPCAAIDAPKIKARTRTLAGPEIQRIWRAAGMLPAPAGAYVRFLIATGVRRNEALGARWSEIEGNHWHIPASRMKAKREFTVPLTPVALATLPKRAKGDFIFSMTYGVKPIGGVTRIKAALDAAIEADGAGPLAPWTFHDFRRSLSTWLAENGVDYVIADLCLAHLPPLSKVGLNYQRSWKRDERRQALERWSAFLDPSSTSPALALRVVSST
jgi:integrase